MSNLKDTYLCRVIYRYGEKRIARLYTPEGVDVMPTDEMTQAVRVTISGMSVAQFPARIRLAKTGGYWSAEVDEEASVAA
jgi:hypothetical protein